MNIYEIMKTRRSIRAYNRDLPVEEEKLNRILEAVRLAPSAANKQPVCFFVIKDDKKKRQLQNAYNEEWFFTAPVIICACSLPENAWKRMDGKNYADVDATIAMDHLILAATSEGLATCWVAAFKVSFVKSILNLPPGVEPVAMTPLGYPLESQKPVYRKPLKEMVRFV
ncbi:MAG: nitroreductase family protein [Candidatus Brocadiaceae bacterium]|nr:nitroreductase family protein [Candidatus Brocadiaceae bacterium]